MPRAARLVKTKGDRKIAAVLGGAKPPEPQKVTPLSGDPQPLISRKTQGLKGRIRVPGDKSMSHRALMLGAISIGETRIRGLLESDDVLATARAMDALGAKVTTGADGAWHVRGVGVAGLTQPEAPLDFGNAGTGVRLCLGLMASTPLTARCIGDASLSRRPMGRVIEPLQQIGARFEASRGQSPAAHHSWRQGCRADHLHASGSLRPGQIGGAARRPQHPGPHHRHRADRDPRSHRTHARRPSAPGFRAKTAPMAVTSRSRVSMSSRARI